MIPLNSLANLKIYIKTKVMEYLFENHPNIEPSFCNKIDHYFVNLLNLCEVGFLCYAVIPIEIRNPVFVFTKESKELIKELEIPEEILEYQEKNKETVKEIEELILIHMLFN